MIDEDSLQERKAAMLPHLDERQRRLFAAAEAKAAGYGGIAAVARLTRIAASTIGRGLKDLEAPETLPPGRVRRPGGGRKSLVETDSRVLDDLNALVEPDARGDPMSPLRWTCKSLRRLAAELTSPATRSATPWSANCCRRRVQSAGQSQDHGGRRQSGPRRAVPLHQRGGRDGLGRDEPVISVDTKKKELVGDFKNAGREWRPQGSPEEVRVHDFLIKELGRAVPYGIYDLAANAGWVNVGIDHDTAAFAVQTIRRWWQDIGRVRYPLARRLLITADGGGSNGSRVRLWKRELQKLADELGIAIEVHHLPPGTSKWNKIEHRLFSFITQNWRAKPLVSYRVIVDLIAATTTKTGLNVRCELDANSYPKGIVVSDDEMAGLNIEARRFPRRMELYHRSFNPITRSVCFLTGT